TREAVSPSSPCSAVATRVRDQPATVSFRAYGGAPCLASGVGRLLPSCQGKREGGTVTPPPNIPSAAKPKNRRHGEVRDETYVPFTFWARPTTRSRRCCRAGACRDRADSGLGLLMA